MVASETTELGHWLAGRELGVSREALQLYLDCDVIDTSSYTLLWDRIFGYRFDRKHEPRLRGTPFFNQIDIPRAVEAQVRGMFWGIVGFPFARAAGRRRRFLTHLRRLEDILAAAPDCHRCHSASDYREARAAGKIASFIHLQGAHAFGADLETIDQLEDGQIVSCTLVHLTDNEVGYSNTRDRHPDEGLSAYGRQVVERLQARRILVDTAHISGRGLLEAIECGAKGVPIIDTHTGVDGAHRHWRNISDEAIRAIADTGGYVGIIFHPPFLTGRWTCPPSAIVDHMEHIIRVAGEDVPGIGSDMDGCIRLPRGFTDIRALPVLVEEMLRRGWSEERVRKVMGGNILRVIGAVRP